MTIERALQRFDPADPDHLLWFKGTLGYRLDDEAEVRALVQHFNESPFGLRLSGENFTMLPMIHGILAVSYCRHALVDK